MAVNGTAHAITVPNPSSSGPLKCYVTLFSGNLTPTQHHVTLITLTSGRTFACHAGSPGSIPGPGVNY